MLVSNGRRVGVAVFLPRDAEEGRRSTAEQEHHSAKDLPITMLASRVAMLAIGIFILFAALPLGSSAALPAYCGAPPVLAPPPLY
jgi:hypothetical protein